MSWPYKVVIFNTTPMDFLGFHLLTFLSTLSPHFLFTLHAYKSFIPYLLLHFLIKLIIDLCVFSCFLTSVSSTCNIFLWFVECLLLFLNIPSSFPLCTSIHNSLNLTHLSKNEVFTQYTCSLDSSTAKNEHQNWLLKWIISSMPSLSFLLEMIQNYFSLLRFCFVCVIQVSKYNCVNRKAAMLF